MSWPRRRSRRGCSVRARSSPTSSPSAPGPGRPRSAPPGRLGAPPPAGRSRPGRTARSGSRPAPGPATAPGPGPGTRPPRPPRRGPAPGVRGRAAARPAQVDLVGEGAQQAARRSRHQPPLGQRPAQPRHRRLEGAGQHRRGVPPPTTPAGPARWARPGWHAAPAGRARPAGELPRTRSTARRPPVRADPGGEPPPLLQGEVGAPRALSRHRAVTGQLPPAWAASASCQRSGAGSGPTAKGTTLLDQGGTPCRSSREGSCWAPCWPS